MVPERVKNASGRDSGVSFLLLCLPLCQIALIPQPHPAMSAYVIN